MPVIGSSFDLSVEMVQEGEMRRSVASVGVVEEVLVPATLMRTLMSGADCIDIVALLIVVRQFRMT